MNARALKAILSHVVEAVSCPNCSARYDDEQLTVVSSIDERCIVVAQCSGCPAAVLITAVVHPLSAGDHTAPSIEHLDHTRVSSSDVQSIHELLKDFKGDLSRLMDAGGDHGTPPKA